uniref:Acrosin n=1 Tax=Phasianus colchicus TaxID=9054 RepID=A0A669QLR2_PHACC
MGCRAPPGAMLLLLPLVVLLAACRPGHGFSGSCDTCGLRPIAYHYNNMRIVGGTEALHGSWPWIVSIQNPRFSGTGHMCGGSLITPQWVLSAAHCFGRPNYILESRVVIGANDLTHLGQEVEVHTIRRAILHEYFNNKTMINDIALLELDRPVHCSYYIQLACVPDPSLRVSELTDCYVSGWGHMGMRSAAPTQTAEVLQEAKGGIDTCQGDSGGPLMCKDKTADYFWLIGVTSWGKGCGRIQQPGVYASTQYFRNWILVQMGLLPAEAPTTPYPVYISTSYERPKPTYSSPFRPCPFPRQKLLDFFNLLQELLQGLRGKKA